MPTFPNPGISRSSVVVKPNEVRAAHEVVPVDLRDVRRLLETRTGAGTVKDTDLGKALAAILKVVEDVVSRLNAKSEDDARDHEQLQQQINDVLSNLRVVDDKATRRLNDILQWGTLANRPATKGTGRFYMATDQAAGSRLTFDDPASGGYIAP